MSRIGKLPITIPKGVEIKFDNKVVSVKGAKGTLKQNIDPDINVKIDNGILTVERPSEQKRHKALHGLYRALISNMINGVSTGYKAQMELVGVGFRATSTGQLLERTVGFSHPVMFLLPNEVKVSTVHDKGKNPIISLESADKQLIGQVCAKIRSIRAPEPYKGKGIRFVGEIVRRKAGKTAAK